MSKYKHKVVFTKPLNVRGVRNLVVAILEKAITEKDVWFFESGTYLCYEQFLKNVNLDASQYIRRMK